MNRGLLSIVFFCISIAGFSQQETHSVIANAGGSEEVPFGTLEWTLGELITETLDTTAGSATQGFHQPVYNIIDVGEKDVELRVNIFPNPAVDRVEVEIENEGFFNARLYDAVGKLLMEIHDIESKFMFHLSRFQGSQYLLKVKKQDDILFKTYKIIKH